MDNLITLILTHFVSDWFFQPTKWAMKKNKKIKYRLLHSIQYTALFIPILYLIKINFLWLIWIFLSHFLIDGYKFINWWNRTIKGEKRLLKWLIIVEDQILHIIVLIPLVLNFKL